MTSYAYVRSHPVAFASLGDAARHARGDDAHHRRRDDADDSRAVVAWRPDDAGEWRMDVAMRGEDHPANDYVALYKAHKRRHKAGEYGKYPPVRHLLVGVSPAALGGDGHDPQSTAVRRLVDAARQWAEQEFGGVFACRCDIDEQGQGVVDVLVAPVREMRCGRAKAPKRKILPTRALREFAQRNGGRTVFDSYRLAQDSWAAFARSRGYDVVRGNPKTETGREHLSPEQYGAAVDGAADYVAHQKAIAKSIDRRTRQLAKENAKRERLEGRAEARRGAAQAAERQAAAALREAAEAKQTVADREAEVEARAEAVEAEADEARRLRAEAERVLNEAWGRARAVRREAEKLERELRDSRAETTAAMRRCRLAIHATMEAAETIAAGGDLRAPYAMAQDAQCALDGDDAAERRLAARYDPPHRGEIDRRESDDRARPTGPPQVAGSTTQRGSIHDH